MAVKIPAGVQADWKMAAVLLVGAVGLYFLAKREVGAAAAAVGTAVNPVSRENLAYRATTAIVGATAGQTAGGPQNLGEWFYSKVNPTDWATLQRARSN